MAVIVWDVVHPGDCFIDHWC